MPPGQKMADTQATEVTQNQNNSQTLLEEPSERVAASEAEAVLVKPPTGSNIWDSLLETGDLFAAAMVSPDNFVVANKD
jgi:hypothetical protein